MRPTTPTRDPDTRPRHATATRDRAGLDGQSSSLYVSGELDTHRIPSPSARAYADAI